MTYHISGDFAVPLYHPQVWTVIGHYFWIHYDRNLFARLLSERNMVRILIPIFRYARYNYYRVTINMLVKNLHERHVDTC